MRVVYVVGVYGLEVRGLGDTSGFQAVKPQGFRSFSKARIPCGILIIRNLPDAERVPVLLPCDILKDLMIRSPKCAGFFGLKVTPKLNSWIGNLCFRRQCGGQHPQQL